VEEVNVVECDTANLAWPSHDQCGERFTDAQGHSGLGRACNLKVCVVVSGLLAVLHVLLPVLASFTQHFVSGLSRGRTEIFIFVPSKAPKNKFSRSKAPKNRFSAP
jgi:hypothetical protein